MARARPGSTGRGVVRPGRDRGFVTAESALVLPTLVLFAMTLVWALLAAAAQIQCVDAARAGARVAARQDPQDAVVAMARRVAPDDASVMVSRKGDLVTVRVAARPPGPLPFTVSDEAVALAEETVGTGGGVGGGVRAP